MSRAAASASRWRMPSEYARYRLPAAASRPTRSSAVAMRVRAVPGRRYGPPRPGGPDLPRRTGTGGTPDPPQGTRPGAAPAGAAGGHRLRPSSVVVAGGRPDQPEQHPDGGGLPGAVGPQEAVHAAPRHREVDAVDRGLAAEPLGQAAG